MLLSNGHPLWTELCPFFSPKLHVVAFTPNMTIFRGRALGPFKVESWRLSSCCLPIVGSKPFTAGCHSISQVSHHHVDHNKNLQEKLFLIVECLKSFSLRWRERSAEMQDLLLSSSIRHGMVTKLSVGVVWQEKR